jgi:O-antigen/teichoic acid export membrane protein
MRVGKFGRNVLVIMTGTVAAQAVTILASPVLTRLYSPEDFGVYALFLSMTSLLGSLVCARYELSITLPASHRHGLALLGVCTVISLAVALVLVPVFWLGGGQIVNALNEPRIAPWLWFLPATMFVTGFAAGARYWLLRTKAFRAASLNAVLRSLLAAACNICFGVIGWVQFGLIGGLLLGLLGSAAFLAAQIWRESRKEICGLQWSDLWSQAHAQRRFPIFSLGSGIVEAGAGQIPVFFLSSLFGAGTLGWFSLAQRVANLPLTLVAQSVADVFRQRASELYARDGQCRVLFDRTFNKLFWPSLPAFLAVAWVSPYLFALIFGETWRESGEYVRYLTPALALRFVANPLSSMFYIAQRQALDLFIQIALIATIVAVFLWAGRVESEWSARHLVIAYSAIYSLKYLSELFLSRRFAYGKASS